MSTSYMAAVEAAQASPTCGYCRDCKWWNEPGISGRYAGIGQCGIVHPMEEVPEAELLEYKSFGSGYDDSGSLLTRADFGCIQFEAK